MTDRIITFEELCEATGYKRAKELRENLEDNQIPFIIGKDGRLWTTTGLVMAAKGFGDKNTNMLQTPDPSSIL